MHGEYKVKKERLYEGVPRLYQFQGVPSLGLCNACNSESNIRGSNHHGASAKVQCVNITNITNKHVTVSEHLVSTYITL